MRTPHTTEHLLQEIESAYRALMGFIENFHEQKIVERTAGEAWSVKDTLAHIAAWEEVLLRFHLAGEPFENVIGMEGVRYRVTPFDEINQNFHLQFKDRSMEQIRDFAQRIHAALTTRLSHLSDEELAAQPQTLLDMGYEAVAFIEYIAGNTYEHYVEHLDTLQRIFHSNA